MKNKILIIEDHKVNRELMCYLLQMSNYEVIEAEDGESGIRLAEEKLPSLIICDIRMPDISGFQVLRQLKKNSKTDSIPVLAVTAQSMTGDREEILSWGFDGYFSKPIDPVSFVEEIENFMPDKSVGKKNHLVKTSGTNARRDPLQKPKAVILVVDNLQMNLDLAVSLLEGNNYKTSTALSMFEAMALLETGVQPDLIISDVVMQDGSGFDFIKAVKASREYRDIPFMFLTSTARSRDQEDTGKKLGAVRYVLRPIDGGELLTVIDSVFTESSSDRKGGG